MVALRLATGSATVATITAAGIVAPLADRLAPTRTALPALATGAGSLFLSHVNDAGFWLVTESFGLTVGRPFRSWSVMETAVSLAGFGFVLLLSTFLQVTDSATMRAAALPPSGLRRVLLVLCLTEITSWGVLYYAFPVLAPAVTADTDWSPTSVTAAFSVGQVTAALVGVPVGRWLDRWGPRRVMTAGSVLAVPAVLGIATAPSLGWFFAAWVAAGVAMAGVLYPPAFAALTRWWGPRRVTALTGVTLVAGLASTVFAPLTAGLAGHLDWRHTYVILACVLAVITVPAHLFGLRGQWPAVAVQRHRMAPDAVARSRAFVVLAVAMSLAAFTLYAVVVNLVPLLTGRGLSTATAALALGLGGLGQVSGRLGYSQLAGRVGVRARTVAVLVAGAAVVALLAVVPGPTPVLFAIAILAGVTRGAFTLVQATAVSDRWGATHFGRLNGMLSAPVTFAMSLGPWAGTAFAGWLGGYQQVFLLLAAIGLVAGVLASTANP